MLSCLDRILQCLLFHICFAARKHLSFDFTSRSISKKELVLLHRLAMSAVSQKAVHMVGEPGAFPHRLRTYVRIFLVSTPYTLRCRYWRKARLFCHLSTRPEHLQERECLPWYLHKRSTNHLRCNCRHCDIGEAHECCELLVIRRGRFGWLLSICDPSAEP